MCVVSMVGDYARDRYEPKMPIWFPDYKPTEKKGMPDNIFKPVELGPPKVTREEFDALKQELEMVKELLKAAKLYDERNNEPDCELDEKIAILKVVAKAFDVNLEDVFGK